MFGKKNDSSQPAAPTENAAEDNGSKANKKGAREPKKFLFIYIFALLFIALVLVVLSYFSQIRAAREEISGLREDHNFFSASTLGAIDKLSTQLDLLRTELSDVEDERDRLTDENRELSGQVNSLQDELARVTAELSTANETNDKLSGEKTALEFTLKCVSDAEEVIRLLSEKKYSEAAEIVTALRGSNGEGEIAKFAALNESYSGAVAKLINRGYLDK